MDGKELLKHLMREASENPNSLADTLKKRSLQSQLQRFIDGATKEPRVSTLRPVADHYKVPVEAFFVASIAQQIAIDRNLLTEHELQLDEIQRLVLLNPILDYAAERDWEAIDLARAIDRPVKFCEQLLRGDVRLTKESADQIMEKLRPQVNNVVTAYPSTTEKGHSSVALANLAMELGIELEKIDERARKPIAEALREVIARPDQAKYYSGLISAMLSIKQTRAA